MVQTGFLPVSGGHTIYYEVHGRVVCDANKQIALYLHGGPGGGFNHKMLRFYDLTQWTVVLFDQRGCGKSTPFGSLEHNTTWDLVADIESLRLHLSVDKWFVAGGSWGTTLALAYAETHPSRVTALLLRGLCFCDEVAMRWLYEKGGASEVYPEQWEKFVEVLPVALRDKGWRTIATFYQKKLQSADTQVAQKYSNRWWGWEGAVSYLVPRPDDTTPKEALAIALLENHYFVNNCWLKKDQLLRGLSVLRNIPITIIHGRYDMVCPISAVAAFKKALPHTKVVITLAGHAGSEKPTLAAFKRATRAVTTRAVRRLSQHKKTTRRRHHTRGRDHTHKQS